MRVSERATQNLTHYIALYSFVFHQDIVAEWLRRWIANPLLFERVCSNHTDVENFLGHWLSTLFQSLSVQSQFNQPMTFFAMRRPPKARVDYAVSHAGARVSLTLKLDLCVVDLM